MDHLNPLCLIMNKAIKAIIKNIIFFPNLLKRRIINIIHQSFHLTQKTTVIHFSNIGSAPLWRQLSGIPLGSYIAHNHFI